jgi:hypothetical protein
MVFKEIIFIFCLFIENKLIVSNLFLVTIEYTYIHIYIYLLIPLNYNYQQ